MLKFFRRIRQTLLSENKFAKYFLYAIGEIVLVVIGILIALQINTWNAEKLEVEKERKILLEIKENLKEDIQNIEKVQKFNRTKFNAIDSAYYYLSMMNTNPGLGKDFSRLLPVLTNYELFKQVMVAFNNMTSSGLIKILSSDDLRQQISRYYSNDILNGVQDQLKVTAQGFLDNVAPKMINKSMMRFITKKDFDVIELKDIRVHKDPQVLSDLFVMKNKIREHNKILDKIASEVNSLITSIETYTNEMI